MRLYLDTSVLGALTDREDPRRVEVTRRLLRAVADGLHAGVLVNVRTRRAIHAVNLRLGQPLIEIVSPEEV
ncbi:MAG TPA: hypothetical protein VJA25_09390 [Dehalococcoidia bacterium]|nr:hypothetical protein [Dehalococcoidia bacterium]